MLPFGKGTTLNLYSHVFQEAKARNCDAITNALSFAHPTEKPGEGETSEPKSDDEEELDELAMNSQIFGQ